MIIRNENNNNNNNNSNNNINNNAHVAAQFVSDGQPQDGVVVEVLAPCDFVASDHAGTAIPKAGEQRGRMRFGPTQPVDASGFGQRTGLPVRVCGRHRGTTSVSVAMHKRAITLERGHTSAAAHDVRRIFLG